MLPLVRRGSSRRAEGFILVPMLFLVAVAVSLSLGFLGQGLAENRAVRLTETRARALELAEVGLLVAEQELRAEVDHGADGVGFATGSQAGGEYHVEADRDPDDPTVWTITAVGRHGLSVRRIETAARILPPTIFPYGAFGRDSLYVEGDTVTDAWESAKGTYVSQAVHMDARGPYAQPLGSIGSNGPLTVDGTAATVRGDARAGPGESITEIGHPVITGNKSALPEELLLPDPPIELFEEALLANENGDFTGFSGYDPATHSLVVQSLEKVTLGGGIYFFTNVTVKDQAELRIAGPCRLYVTGRFHILNGGLWNQTLDPRNFLVFAHPYPVPEGFQWKPPTKKGTIQEQVVLSGGSQTAIGLYAPGADVRLIGNASVWGALIGGAVHVIGNPELHYDRSLADLRNLLQRGPQRIYWIERGPLMRR